MDDLELPPLSQSARSEAAQTPPRPSLLLTRKRTHSSYYDDDPATSSDPALFSSDEQAPGAENYVPGGKRKKRTYKGSWWDRHPARHGDRKSQRKRDEFRRNFDSGIFMGSSESEDPLSSDSFSLEDELLRDQQLREEQSSNRTPRAPRPWAKFDDPEATPKAKVVRKAAIQIPKEHEQVCTIVRQCLDQGKEDVDLASMSLSSLPPEVSTLQTLSKQDEIVPGMLDIGTDLEPRLRLFLGNNLLTVFPSPILDLRNLRVLSLRNNNLTSLPAGIRDLVNLESLNVAGNQLTELPGEILDLVHDFRLGELKCHPNPWSNPFDEQGPHHIPLQDDHPASVRKGNLFLRRLCSPQGQWAKLALRPAQNSRVPSLTETVLRQLSRFDPQSRQDFQSFMPSDTPEQVLNHLDVLHRHPGRRCDNCKRPVVLGAREWTEWWYLYDGVSEEEQPLEGPLLFICGNLSAATMQEKRINYLPFRRVQCWDGCHTLPDTATHEENVAAESL